MEFDSGGRKWINLDEEQVRNRTQQCAQVLPLEKKMADVWGAGGSDGGGRGIYIYASYILYEYKCHTVRNTLRPHAMVYC